MFWHHSLKIAHVSCTLCFFRFSPRISHDRRARVALCARTARTVRTLSSGHGNGARLFYKNTAHNTRCVSPLTPMLACFFGPLSLKREKKRRCFCLPESIEFRAWHNNIFFLFIYVHACNIGIWDLAMSRLEISRLSTRLAGSVTMIAGLRKYLSERLDVSLVEFVDKIRIAFQQVVERLQKLILRQRF